MSFPAVTPDISIVEVGPRDGLQNEKGALTLADCASKCSNGNYVACDRYITDPSVPDSCFGYVELFEDVLSAST